MLVRCSAALLAATAALMWIPPRDTYTALAASLLVTGTAGLALVAKRAQLWRLSIEVAAAIVCGWLCVGFEFPASVRDGNWILDEVLPNWECGMIFGWLLAGIGTRLTKANWAALAPPQPQFSLMRLLGSTSLIAASLSVASGCPCFSDEPTRFAIAGSISVVCVAGAAGLLLEQTARLTWFATVVMVALSATVVILENTLY